MWAPGQVLTTRGNPTDATRATLTIGRAEIVCLVYAAVDNTHGLSIQNIQLDGARPALGIVFGGIALVELGGNNVSSFDWTKGRTSSPSAAHSLCTLEPDRSNGQERQGVGTKGLVYYTCRRGVRELVLGCENP